MRAELKSMHSYNDPEDLETFIPEDPEVWAFPLQIIAGPKGEPGEESFNLVVMTPKWLLYNSEEKLVIGRHKLFMFNYDFKRLKQFLVSYVESCTGDTWQEVADKLGRLGYWEFEDYQEYKPE